MDNINICPNCKTQTQLIWNFCPNCGKILKEKPINISIFRQIYIYLISFFLTPMGLYWGLKYIFNKDNKIKLIGWISVVLTILGVLLVLFLSKSVIDQYSKILNNIQMY